MCISGPKAPDTSGQEAEARRQRELEQQRYEQQLAEQQRIAAEQRAMEEARAAEQRRQYEEQLAAQQAAADRQFQQQQQALAAQQAAAEAERMQREQEAAARAAAMEQYTQGRTQRINDFRTSINDAYAGFDDAYYDQFANDFIGYYKPRLEDEFKDAQEQLTFRYANQGGLNSSAAARDLRDLLENKRRQEQEIATRARNAASDFRGDIDSQRKSLLSEALSASNIGPEVLPDGISDVGSQLSAISESLTPYSSLATQRASSVSRPGFGDLGNFFTTAASGAGGGTTARGDTQFNFTGTELYQPNTGKAARVVV